MEHLTGINIRKGIEMHIPVSEIFSLKPDSIGDERIKDMYQTKNHRKYLSHHSDLYDTIAEEIIVFYKDKKNKTQISPDMDAYSFHEYIAEIDERGEGDGSALIKRTEELIFSNNKVLDYDDLAINIMQAQAFSGRVAPPEPNFSFPFIGIGNFEIEEIYNCYHFINASNLNLNHFFIYYKNVLASVTNIVNGTMDTDIKAQKEYLTKKEMKELLEEVKERRIQVAKIKEATNNEECVQ